MRATLTPASMICGYAAHTSEFNMTLDWESAYSTHRWLPVRPETNRTIDDTPIAHTEYDADSDEWDMYDDEAQPDEE